MHSILLIGVAAMIAGQLVEVEMPVECPVVVKTDKYVIHAVPNLHDGGVSLTHTDRATGKVRVFFSTWTNYTRSIGAMDWHSTTWTQVIGLAMDEQRLYVLLRRDGDGLGLGMHMKTGTTLQVFWRDDGSKLGSHLLQDDEGAKVRLGALGPPPRPKSTLDLLRKGPLVAGANGVSALGHEFHYEGKKLRSHIEPKKKDKK